MLMKNINRALYIEYIALAIVPPWMNDTEDIVYKDIYGPVPVPPAFVPSPSCPCPFATLMPKPQCHSLRAKNMQKCT